MKILRDQRVLITGASSGIGAAAAELLAQSGAYVALVSEQEDALNDVAARLRGVGGRAEAFVADFTCPEQVSGLIGRVEARIGPLDVVINNAGIGLSASVFDARSSDMRELFEINFFALAELCKQALTVMAPRGRGRIINVSSAAGLFGSPMIGIYSATKGAVHAYTQALRTEGRLYGVAVYEVLPISVKTPFFDNAVGSKYRPTGVVLTVDRVARCILRCACGQVLGPEVLPFRGIRLFFALNGLWPGLAARLASRAYVRSLRRGRDLR